jgi:enterochelin esterase-like enzyme
MGVDERADVLIASGELSPFIIVMPRDRVWSPPEVDMFGQALIQELIPWIDRNYRTIPDRAYRAIGGLSRGASWAVHLGILYWDLFSAVGAHSLPVFPGDTNNIRKWLAAIPTDSVPRFFIDIAELDRWSVTATWFEDILTEMDVPHIWHLYTGSHSETYWGSHLDEYLRWYAQDW